MEPCVWPPSSSSSSSAAAIMSRFTDEKAVEFYCMAVLSVIGKLFYAIFLSFFALVGATLGALIGALVGVKTETGCFHGATVGAIKCSLFSTKLFQISLILWNSEDIATGFLLQFIDACVKTYNEMPRNRANGLPRSSIEKIPKIKITKENMLDASGNGISCSVCLQDFSRGETVQCLPHCRHFYHPCCIDKWLVEHKTCPLCRRNL